MQMKHRVSLDNVQLDSIDDRIMITGVETAEGKENISTVSLMGPSGSRVTKVHRDSLDITVKFVIKLRKTKMADREEVLEKVNAWAYGGGWLRVNYKTNRRIRVFVAQAAGAGDPWDWTHEYSIVFRACGVPYWQQETPESFTLNDISSTEQSMTTAGSEKGVMNVSFVNKSGSTINTFHFDTGESSIAFSSLGLENNETLVIDHYDNGKRSHIRMRILNTSGNYRSVLNKRTTESDDDLFTTPGTHDVMMEAGGAGNLTVQSYGRFA